MEKYFKIRKDLAKDCGCTQTLYRIECIKNLPERGVKKGDLGGFVAKEENLQGKAWLFDDSMAYNNAVVKDNAELHGDSRANWETEVSGNARIYGESFVAQFAKVTDNAVLKDHSTAARNSVIKDNAVLKDYARVIKDSEISGDVVIDGTITVPGEKIGSNQEIVRLNLGYPIVIMPNYMEINSTLLKIEEWFGWSDEKFEEYFENNWGEEVKLSWWKIWKDVLRKITENLPKNKELELREIKINYV